MAAGSVPGARAAGPRCAALVGPYLSGKTTLFESLLFVTGAIPRKGTVKEGNTIGDSAAEARARKMSVEISAGSTQYLGERWTFLDCPGSIEFAHEAHNALMAADVAVVVCEPVVERVLTVAPLLKFLDDNLIPHMIFINKIDGATQRVRDVLAALQGVSERKLALRQIPIREGEHVAGYVDVISERAYHYRPGQPSDLIPLPTEAQGQEREVRQTVLETLADFDDSLLAQLLEDTVPSKEEIYRQLTKDLRSDLIVPVFMGAAERDYGVRRLLKALRHEAPGPEITAARFGVAPEGEALAHVFKTYHVPHAGKLSLARVWRGAIADGNTVNGARIGGLFTLMGAQQVKQQKAGLGDVVALGRLDPIKTGDVLTLSGNAGAHKLPRPAAPAPVFAAAINAEKRADEVKLSGGAQKLCEEDTGLKIEHDPDTHEMLLWGQGEIHLAVAMERFGGKYNVPVRATPPQVPYKETIRKAVMQHGRYKRQTGGHGQFGDVKIEIRPLPRGSGFSFDEKVVGGAVPRNFIPSVEEGAQEFMKRGPLGFKIVDVAVTLLDGQYHDVDSSDAAFKQATRIALSEGMPKCDPVLLEPILHVTIAVPTEFTSRVQRLLSTRRANILGFDVKPGWQGWDEVQALLPQSEMRDMIIELRSLTLGVGTFSWRFDHLNELTGRLADRVVEQRAQALAPA